MIAPGVKRAHLWGAACLESVGQDLYKLFVYNSSVFTLCIQCSLGWEKHCKRGGVLEPDSFNHDHSISTLILFQVLMHIAIKIINLYGDFDPCMVPHPTTMKMHAMIALHKGLIPGSKNPSEHGFKFR